MQHTFLLKQNFFKIIVQVHFPFVVKIGYQTLQLQNPNINNQSYKFSKSLSTSLNRKNTQWSRSGSLQEIETKEA